MKNFDQWMEEISKQVVVRSDEEGVKAPWKSNEDFADDDSDEEESS